MNTRRYPRTTSEAFKDADYACSVKRYDYENAGHRCALIVSMVGVAGFLVWAILGVLQ
jgi:hypothetical protein